ncbi:MAG: class I SAM-dependent methyltransferase [Anaerolineales bacterium]
MASTGTVVLDKEIKQQVRDFYDSVGWRQIGEGLYQNARYEDLRPVSREYIRRCHLRVLRHLPPQGRLLLDAGSGPIQYPEYLEYSRGYERRVCLDISRLALVEARKRVGDHGLFIVGDVSRLPFVDEAFDGVVSLHTVHHVAAELQGEAFDDLHRVQGLDSRAVVVYSWGRNSLLMRLSAWPIQLAEAGIRWITRRRQATSAEAKVSASGTYTHHHDQRWIVHKVGGLPGFEIVVWRSVSTAFLRALVHRRFMGGEFLRLLCWFEDRAPHLMGRFGQYPMIVFGNMVQSWGG